jgi:hypothetical protein
MKAATADMIVGLQHWRLCLCCKSSARSDQEYGHSDDGAPLSCLLQQIYRRRGFERLSHNLLGTLPLELDAVECCWQRKTSVCCYRPWKRRSAALFELAKLFLSYFK